jgi:hypothetical protein
MPKGKGIFGSQQSTEGHGPTVGAKMLIHFHVSTFVFYPQFMRMRKELPFTPQFIILHIPYTFHISMLLYENIIPFLNT